MPRVMFRLVADTALVASLLVLSAGTLAWVRDSLGASTADMPMPDRHRAGLDERLAVPAE